MRQKKIIRLAIAAAAVLCGVFALWMGCRSLLRDEALSSLQARCQARGLRLHYTAPRWTGLRTVAIDTLSLYNGKQLCARFTGLEASPAVSSLWSESALAGFTVRTAWFDADTMPPQSSAAGKGTAAHPLWRMATLAQAIHARLGNWQLQAGTFVIADEHGNKQSLRFEAKGTGSLMQLSLRATERLHWRGSTFDAPASQAIIFLQQVDEESFLLGMQGATPAGKAFHAALSADTLQLREARLSGWARITQAGLQSMPGARLSHAGAFAHWHLRWNAAVEGVLTLPAQPVDALISTAPDGFFSLLRPGQCRGNIKGWASFRFTPGLPQSLSLNGNWRSEGLVLSSEHPLRKLNGGNLLLPSHEQIKINQNVPERLTQAVVLAEDPGFFEGGGMNADMVRAVTLDNLEHGSFRRGGSTIPMQVMRNAFLSQHKTLSRKAEEVLLTWLNEETQTASREQLLRVYLTLAEWGPGIRGAEAAARFYFDKSPDALSMDECIFLAGLLPNPRAWRSQLDEHGGLKPLAQDFFAGMRLQLLDAGWLEEDALEQPVSLHFRCRLSDKSFCEK